MCDYCDCRRIPEIAALGRQHEQIQELADEALKLARAGSEGLAEAISRLRQALDPHVQREEAGVFAQARQAGLGQYHVDDLEDEHRRFALLLDGAEKIDADTLEGFVDELHHHIAVEEYDLFPAAAQLVSDSQWQLAGV